MAANGRSDTNAQASHAVDGSTGAVRARQYLSLEPLLLRQLPPHKDFSQDAQQSNTLASFLNEVLSEAYEFDLENGWTSHGEWQPKTDRGAIKMPAKSIDPDAAPREVLVRVDQRAKGKGKSIWLARRSFHHGQDVDYAEIDALLAQDHARQEADYTPSVIEANELLKWDVDDLKTAASGLDPSWKVQSVQMALFQMFHMMPSAAGGLIKLQNRVFHVLVITAHSMYSDAKNGELNAQALTLQLPVDIQSLSHIPIIIERSHTDPQFKRYKAKSSSNASGSRQQEHDGKRLTEGCYVSLERLRKVNAEPMADTNQASYTNQWDMMTMSDAKGITSIASKKQIVEGTLDAVTKDVYYVLNHIRQQRQDELDRRGGSETGKEVGKMEKEMDFERVKK